MSIVRNTIREQHLRTALELAPRKRALHRSREYLAKRGKAKESDALFDQAERIAHRTPRIFERASRI